MTRRKFLQATAIGVGATVAGGALAGTAVRAQSPAGQKLRFVWSPKATDNPVFAVGKIGADLRAAELGDVEVQWIGPPNTDAQAQAQLLDAAITAGCEGMGISCNDADVLQPVIDRAIGEGIPVITWDSNSPNSQRLGFYSINGDDAAIAGANVFVEAMASAPSKTYALLSGNAGAPNLEGRIAAVRSVLDQTDLEYVTTEFCNDNIQLGAELIESRLTANPDLGGWFLIGGWPLFGEIDAMPQFRDKTAAGTLKCVAWDTLKSQCQYFVDGHLQGLIGQKYFGWGYDGIGIMYDIVKNGITVPAFIDSGFDLVTTTEDAQLFLDAWDSGEFPADPNKYGVGNADVYAAPGGSPAASAAA